VYPSNSAETTKSHPLDFANLYEHWSSLEDPGLASIYLRHTVLNLSRSRLRRYAVERRTANLAKAADRSEAAVLHAPDRLDTIAVLDHLPHRQRQAIILKYYLDLSDREIANSMACSVGTVKSQLSKARHKLARLLRESE
jgi:RNA polymerase sigma factor (sigma-70 family)